MEFLKKRSVALVLSALIVLVSMIYMISLDVEPSFAALEAETTDNVAADPVPNLTSLSFSSLLLTFEADMAYTISDDQTLSFSLVPEGVLKLSRLTGVGSNPTISDVESAFDRATQAFFGHFSHISFGAIEEIMEHAYLNEKIR